MQLEIPYKVVVPRYNAFKANEISTTAFHGGRGCAKSRLDARRKLKLQQSREQSFVRTCLDAQRVASIITGCF